MASNGLVRQIYSATKGAGMGTVKFFKSKDCENIGFAKRENGEKVACYGKVDELIEKELVIIDGKGQPPKEDLAKWTVIWLDKLDDELILYGSKQEVKQAILKEVAQ